MINIILTNIKDICTQHKPQVDLKTHIDKDVLEHMKYIGMCNVEIANLFSVHRNLVARCINDYGIIVPKFTNHTDEEVKHALHEIMNLNNDLGEQHARGVLLTKGIKIHQTRLRKMLRQLKGSRPHAVGNAIKRRTCKNRSANTAWHHDTNHKIIKYKFVVSGCVDGFSRLILWLNISNNNLARTSVHVLKK